MPLQACTMCADAARRDPHSVAAFAALTAVDRLLLAAIPFPNVHQRVWKQVIQSGLLQHVPVLTSATADDLSSHFSSSSSSTQDSPDVSADSHNTRMELRVQCMLQVVLSLQYLALADDKLPVLLSLAKPTLCLVRLATRYFSRQYQRHQEQQPQQQQPQQQPTVPKELGHASMIAQHGCLVLTLMFETPQQAISTGSAGSEWWTVRGLRPEASALLECSDLAPCFAWLVAVATLAATGSWPQHETQSHSNPLFSLLACAEPSETTAWRQVCSNQHLVTRCTQQLCEQGVDQGSVLWCAGMLRHNEVDADALLGTLASFDLAPGSQRALQDSGRGSVGGSSGLAAQDAKLCMLVPSLWVHWATNIITLQPTGSAAVQPPRQEALAAVVQAAQVSCGSLERWEQLSGQAPQQQQQPASDADPRSLSPALVAELLPQILQLLHTLLQQPEQQTQQQDGVAACTRILCLLLQHTNFPAASSRPTTTAQHGSAAMLVVQDNLRSILTTLEPAVRSMAAMGTTIPAATWDRVAASLQVLSPLLLTTAPSSSSGSTARGCTARLQEMCSLMSSILKASVEYGMAEEATSADLFACAEKCSAAVGAAAVQLIRGAVAAAVSDFASTLTQDGASSSGSSSSAGSTPAASQLSADSVSSSIHAVLPSLVLWGRCCLLMAPQLQSSNTPTTTATAGLLLSGMQACHDWLSLVSGQLSAAGYEAQQLVLHLLLCRERFSNSSLQAQHTATTLTQLLHSVGSRLAAFATPCICNNPACANLNGPSDHALVSGLSCICGGCETARYCSKACQRVHWKAAHKPVCKALKQAAAGGC